MIILKRDSEIEIMRNAAQAVFEIHLALSDIIRPGITTNDLERVAVKQMTKLGVTSAYKGYRSFPCSIFTDINDGVCHGIIKDRRLQDGDIVKIGIGVIKDEFHADKTITYGVGQISDEAALLISAVNEAMWQAISQCHQDKRVSDISHSIQLAAESSGYSIVKDFVGHGIGREHHEYPQIPNYGPPGSGPRLRSGMVIKPHIFINAGSSPIKIMPDGWTVVTEDGSLSACATETIAITEAGPEVLTGFVVSRRPIITYRDRLDQKYSGLEIGNLLCGEKIQEIRSGGMGTIYLTNKHAFKTLSREVIKNTNWGMFAKEIDTWLRIPMHENIVRAHTIVPQGGQVFIAMERINGCDLREIMDKRTYAMSMALSWAEQISVGMAFAHDERGLIHRDLKPANILIDKNNIAKITDFGIAFLLKDAEGIKADVIHNGHSGLTRVGNCVGTPAYMSPEQWENLDKIDTCSDIYSYGILLYEMLSGRHPFVDALGSMNTLRYKHLNVNPPDPREYNENISDELAEIIKKCIMKDYSKRYQNFKNITNDIRQIRIKNLQVNDVASEVLFRDSYREFVSSEKNQLSSSPGNTSLSYRIKQYFKRSR